MSVIIYRIQNRIEICTIPSCKQAEPSNFDMIGQIRLPCNFGNFGTVWNWSDHE